MSGLRKWIQEESQVPSQPAPQQQGFLRVQSTKTTLSRELAREGILSSSFVNSSPKLVSSGNQGVGKVQQAGEGTAMVQETENSKQ